MKLSTRLTLLLITMTMLVALCVGWYAVTTSTRSQYATLDSSINAVVDSGLGHPLAALSNALYVVQENSYDLTLDVVDPAGIVTQVNAGVVPLLRKPTIANVRHSLRTVQTAANLPGFRFRSVNVGGGDYLVVAASTSAIVAASHELEARVALASLLAALAMAVIARLVIRRDLRSINQLIAFAVAVAGGDDDSAVPPAGGSSDLRQLRESLAHMVASLRRTISAEKASASTMQRFIGDASHELRTPLTVIRGYSELLENPDIDEVQRARALERVQREVGRMDTLVDDLLFLAEVKEMPSRDDSRLNLSELVRESVNDFIADHERRSVTVDVEPDIHLGARRDFLERLVNNALTNIARHTADDVAVAVSLRRSSNGLRLRIEDAGPGLPANAYGESPRRFQRFDASRSRTSGGSGLGMSIMADVTSALGGTMATSRSTLGGLCITFEIPQ